MQTLEISFLQIFYILWHERQRRQPAASSDCNVQNNCRMEKTHEPSGKLSLFSFEKLHENMGLERGGSILRIVACRKKIRQKQLSERMHVKRSEVPVKSLRLTRFNGVNFTTWTLFFCLKKHLVETTRKFPSVSKQFPAVTPSVSSLRYKRNCERTFTNPRRWRRWVCYYVGSLSISCSFRGFRRSLYLWTFRIHTRGLAKQQISHESDKQTSAEKKIEITENSGEVVVVHTPATQLNNKAYGEVCSHSWGSASLNGVRIWTVAAISPSLSVAIICSCWWWIITFVAQLNVRC